MKPLEPPRVATAIIRTLVPGLYGEDFLAELRGEFLWRAEAGGAARWFARLWYWGQALSLNTLRLRWGVLESERRALQRLHRRPTHRSSVDSVVQDCRDAVRSVRKSPAYATTVVATFALAVGAHVAVFSVVNSVLLRPLPYPDPGALITIKRVSLEDGVESRSGGVSLPDFRDWQSGSTSLSHMAAYVRARETYFGERIAEEWFGVETTPELFETLGVAPLIGRALHPNVDPPTGGDGIVLSHRLWQTRFNGDSSVVGRAIRFEDRIMTVIGVMPAGFYFPTPAAEYWATLGSFSWIENRRSWGLSTVARLAANVDLSAAREELSVLAAVTDKHPDAIEESAGVYLETRHDTYVGDTKKLFALLTGAVLVVLAIACANIANLGLTRAAVRQREFAIRSALGAARTRLMRQLFAESVLLALVGAVVGVGVAYGAVRVLLTMVPANLPRQHEIGVDATAMLFATATAVLCGIAFGFAPALNAARAENEGLRERGTSGVRRQRTLKLLVVIQIGLSQVLVVTAGLLLNSFVRLSSIQPGFDTEHTLTMQIHLPRDGYATRDQVLGLHRQLAENVKALPGVVNAGMTSHLPFTSWADAGYHVEGEDSPDYQGMNYEVISEDYLQTMGIPVLSGRYFDASAGPGQQLVALVNQRMADLHWSGTSPIGRRFAIGRNGEWITVIGIVGTVLHRGLADVERPTAYLSLRQVQSQRWSGRHVYLAVRSVGAPGAMSESVRQLVATIDRHVAITRVRTTAGLVADAVAEPRFRTILIGSFAVLALLVALVGIYGVMGFVVAQRRQEIGVRMALGASSAGVLRHVLLGGTRLIVLGVAVGTAVAVATSRTLSGMLFGITPADPITFTSVTALLAVVALGACYLPARRASRVDPMGTLRVE